MTNKEICEEIVKNRGCGYVDGVECKDCPLNNGGVYDCVYYNTSIDAALSWLRNFREEDESEQLKKENAELRVQLASYEDVMRCAKNLVSVKGTLHNFMSIGLHADNTPAFKVLEKAVRAAKEVSSGRS